ncbi:MAG: NADH-quinone oxidoreductase subunit N [Vicinamibacteria bacterium]|jgi:NADH-quinone oxidoreductase subunit N|nr:NADH-quinone oxidoreductase subunit N [Vicinamibacteria bacterium]
MNELLPSLAAFLPEITLTVGLLLVILIDATLWRHRAVAIRWLSIVTLLKALVLCLWIDAPLGSMWSGMLAVDPLTIFFRMLLIAAALLIVLVFHAGNARELRGLSQGEFYALILAVTLSGMLLAASNDIVMLYLAFEMVSIGSYVLVAYIKGDRRSNEAALKYLLFGAASSGVMLFGLSLLFGLTGTTSLPAIREMLAFGLTDANHFAAMVIALLILAGFAFKTAAVPFHFWCPDAYEGAPTPVAAFLSIAPKAAGFAILTRFFYVGFTTTGNDRLDLAASIAWPQILMLLSVATMTIGNLAAITQTNMKRLLAYSSIAHAGYIMMGVVALSEDGLRGILVYLLAYIVMNTGAFFVVTLIHDHDGSFDLRDYPNLYRRNPLLTIAMSIFLLSLMGIPPLVGFAGKLYVFAAIIAKGPALYWFALIGALNAAVAAFYYARVLKTMIIDAGNEERPALVLPRMDTVWIVVLMLANFLPLFAWRVVDPWVLRALALAMGR